MQGIIFAAPGFWILEVQLVIFAIDVVCSQQVARVQSVCEALVKASEQFAEWPCLGYRMVKNGIAENKFTW